MEGSRSYFVGIDWASDKHDVCVIDEAGTRQATFAIPHTAEGLTDLLRCLKPYGDPCELPVAIERPSGLLVDTLVEVGYVVVPTHPNALKATRPRYSAALVKSDPGRSWRVCAPPPAASSPLTSPNTPTAKSSTCVRHTAPSYPAGSRATGRVTRRRNSSMILRWTAESFLEDEAGVPEDHATTTSGS